MFEIMFNSKKGNSGTIEVNPNTLNLIGGGTVITGTLTTSGDIRIDGSVTGTVTSKAKVVMGDSSRVAGDVYCQSADISGVVEGNIFVEDLLTLKSTARIIGDINTKKLIIEVGAGFNGSCHMNANGEFGREFATEAALQESRR
jgi:cytoskeletal protein CcmA (bactofilin family)